MSETRKIAAILVADVVGYSRLAGTDEDRTLSRLRGLRSDLIDPAIAAHHGRVVKRTGDGSLVEFRSVVDALRCGIEVQNGMIERNAGHCHGAPGLRRSRWPDSRTRMTKLSYSGYRFPPEVIHQTIWLYLRFTLSLRDVEDLLAERGVAVSYETVRRWVNHFGPMIADDLRKRR